ncbi:thiol-specific monooxygenase [Aspergillus steynii IBT 23096]|uniref:Thiol-specific monooxygenase n=1 Tax=Aspergillus steynii IBT 23096 TaxID=1392250 RepID=A0A2I2G6U8_9EURO|nr:thiol-specific monooxygenase [Aspergillus steynii IBT 23096]PLB48598.1 thiol-specific monooxygenase [Aspergillus steynii IBT 23096]
MTKPIRRVAVIGAGPAGAIATDALVKEQAFDTIRVFERQDIPGGTWVWTPATSRRIPSLRDLLKQRLDRGVPLPGSFPCQTEVAEAINSSQLRFADTGAHEHLHSNLPPGIMCFTQEPIPARLSERTVTRYGQDSPFRHREVIREWVGDIFTRGNHHDLVEFGTTVEQAEHTGDEWVLTLRKTLKSTNNLWWQERFDAVVVATGHYYLPYIPDIPGLADFDESFPGIVQHSKHYRNAEDYGGKRVIVVGGSVSAFDAIHDIRQVASKPVISSLRQPSPLFGTAPFTHPDIDNRPQIARFDAETGTVHFADGSSTDAVDVVLFATGYDFSFPFLPELQGPHKRVPGLYYHVFSIDRPNLAFIGMVTGGFGIRVFEWQAVATARMFAGRATLPSHEEMKMWEQDRLATRGDGAPFWTLMPDFETYFEQLRLLAGDPAPGSTGRTLPKYDPAWAEAFWQLIERRIQWWTGESQAASR